MSIERTYYCDGPDCGGDGGLNGGATSSHAQTATPPPHLPVGFIEARDVDPSGESVHHFCGWDCLMKFAAAKPLPEIVSLNSEDTDHE